MKFHDKTLKDTAVVLDGNEFRRVLFDGCHIHYSGTKTVNLRGCTFRGCQFVFDGPAGNTLAMMSGMYQGGFKEMVEQTFEWIRTGQIAHTLQ